MADCKETYNTKHLTLSQVGQVPFLDRLLYKNPILLWMSKHNLWDYDTPVVHFARRCISAKHSSKVAGYMKGPVGRIQGRDFYSRFVEARQQDPEFISEERVLALTVGNMIAGSDVGIIRLVIINAQVILRIRCSRNITRAEQFIGFC